MAALGPQLLILTNTFHMSRPKGLRGRSLMGTSEWIGVEPCGVEKGARDCLSAAHLTMCEAIASSMTSIG